MAGFAFEGRQWLWREGQRTELKNTLVRLVTRFNAAPALFGSNKTRLTRKPICLYSTQRYHTNESDHDEVKVIDIESNDGRYYKKYK
jgi:hypothetical protein